LFKNYACEACPPNTSYDVGSNTCQDAGIDPTVALKSQFIPLQQHQLNNLLSLLPHQKFQFIQQQQLQHTEKDKKIN
jgi:hypothetical protein